MPSPDINTLGQLKASGYQSVSVKEEIRKNLIKAIGEKKNVFDKIKGYDNTVIPEFESSLLAKHNILFLGLRGQAKTMMARMMVKLLDEYMPAIEGAELFDDPLAPITRYGKEMIAQKGDDTPIVWIHRDERYVEKLATPDVSVADLVGDLDPIKAATQKLTYADERVIHFGMIPRAHRCIFVINELPDLQARIQVALFNILQEGDIQIRGFNIRLPVDLQFVFTANPEDYTNRGSIVTPLKDRIESQILTHYPKSTDISKIITHQEAQINTDLKARLESSDLIDDLIEEIAFAARESEYVDQKSGVSARLTISAYELLHSVAERRMLINKESHVYLRIADLVGIVPAINGKIELVYEGEQEGSHNVSLFLLGKAIRKQFENIFPDPEKLKKQKDGINPYGAIIAWFNKGNEVNILQNMSVDEYQKTLSSIDGLDTMVEYVAPQASGNYKYLLMEFALHGLAEYSQLSKQVVDARSTFKDLVGSMFNMDDFDPEEELY